MPLAVVDAAGRGRPEFYATLGNGSMPVEVLSPGMSPRGTSTAPSNVGYRV